MVFYQISEFCATPNVKQVVNYFSVGRMGSKYPTINWQTSATKWCLFSTNNPNILQISIFFDLDQGDKISFE